MILKLIKNLFPIKQIRLFLQEIKNLNNHIGELSNKLDAFNISLNNLFEINNKRNDLFDILKEVKKREKNWFEKCIIYDVGMHKGEDTEYYLKKGFSVVAIEANPDLCRNAELNFSDYIKNKKLIILNIGIHHEGIKEETFFINEEINVYSSFIKKTAERISNTSKAITIKCDTLSNIIKNFGNPYYIKIDIEGFDYIALESLINNNITPPYISVENGSIMLKKLYDYGYNNFKFIQQNNINNLKQFFPPLEGNFVNHTFLDGSSGPFGEETPGKWYNYKDIYVEISKAWDIENGMKNPLWNDANDGWFDLHARHKNYKGIVEKLIKH